ncbi:chemotaxis protein [Bacillus sp. V5-8f]|nr:methyl-accepting chemotaxis protein [Bacillus sp. V5-8f]PLT33343.1 chemotaxis protein [Bacillus sp. V5-8f]
MKTRKKPRGKLKMRMNIKTRLIIAFMAILIVPTTTIGWFSYQKAANQITTEIEKNAVKDVESVNNQINELLSSSLEDLDYLAKTVNGKMVQGETSPELRKILDPVKAVQPEYDHVQFATTTGVLLNSPQQQFDAGFDVRERPWYIKAIENKGTALVNSPIISQDEKVIIVPSKSTNDGSGVVSVVLSLSNLTERVNKIKVGDKGFVSIMDQEGKYLTHPKLDPGTENKDATVSKFYAKDSGIIDYEAKEERMVFVTNKMTGWKIVGTIEMSEVASATNGILYTTIAVIVVSILIGILLVLWNVRSVTSPLNQLKEGMKEIASGNLAYRADSKRDDEIGHIFKHLNEMSESLKHLIGKISANSELISSSAVQLTASSEQTSQAAEHISYTIQEVASGTERQSESVEQAIKIVSEMDRGVQQITANAKNVSVNASNTSEKANIGNQAIQNSIQQMNAIQTTVNNLGEEIKGLGDQSKQIGDIIQTITNIAGQTNLLALNAAIEAARAGESGKGFAVVADEVRKLAEQSAAAAEQITHLISKNKQQTDVAVKTMEATTQEVLAGIELVNTAGQSFNEIRKATDDVTKQTEEVAAAIQQISESAKMIVSSIDTIAEVAQNAAAGTQNVSASTQEQLASLEEVSASASSLSGMAEELQMLVRSFKI